MKVLKAVYRGFCRIEEALCSIGFATMAALVFIAAVARVVGKPISWNIDVAQLLLCWTSLIGADIAFKKSKFLGLDLLTNYFPIKVQRILAIIMDALILIALVCFVYFGTILSIDSWKRSFQTLTISYSYVTMALPIMSAFMSVSVILDIKKKIDNFNAPKPEINK